MQALSKALIYNEGEQNVEEKTFIFSNQGVNIIKNYILNPVFYVTRDIERALGLNLSISNYYIISNYTEYGKSLAKKYKNILLIKEEKMLDTWELLKHSKVKKNINHLSSPRRRGSSWLAHNRLDPRLRGDDRRHSPDILVFKNTSQIEKICHENNWNLLNPATKLSNEIEEKISQIKWLGSLKKYLPKYQIKKCGKIKWGGKKFVLQFNHSHTGSGTLLIENENQLNEIKNKFPLREARVADYIDGPLFTNNNIVWEKQILFGNINYQITGLKPFTDLRFATIGNDWTLPNKILSAEQIKKYKKIANDVGQRMKKFGWKGLFGIDVVIDKKTGRLYLLEINARQPASASFESGLQQFSFPQRRKTSKRTTIDWIPASAGMTKYYGQ